MKRLIINGDDFGLSEGISSGIVHCMKNGCVTSTTIMPCAEGALERLENWKTRIPGSTGVHLQLTSGKPFSPPDSIPSLVFGDCFPKDVSDLAQLNVDEVEREWRAQIEAVIEVDQKITHLDSHHGHHRHNRLINTYTGLARKYGLAARGGNQSICRQIADAGVPTADLCESRWLRGDLTIERFLKLVAEDFELLHDAGTVEIVTHPGFVDSNLAEITRYSHQRGRELEILCSDDLLNGLRKQGIELITYKDL